MRRNAQPEAPDAGVKPSTKASKPQSMRLADVANVVRAFVRPVMVKRAKHPDEVESPVLKRAAEVGAFAETLSFALDDGYNGTINERIRAMVGRFEATMGGRDPETGLLDPVKHIPKFHPTNEIVLFIAIVPGHKVEEVDEALEATPK